MSASSAQDAVLSVSTRLDESSAAVGRRGVRRKPLSRTALRVEALEWAGGLLVGLTLVTVLVDGSWAPAVLSLAAWTWATWFARPPRVAPRTQRVRVRLSRGLVTCAAVAVGSVVLGTSADIARDCLVVVAGAASAAAVLTLWRTPQQPARRVVLVGERRQVDALADRVDGSAGLKVVGACVPKAGTTIPVQTSLRVPTSFQLSSVPDLVDQVEADCVLAVPGEAVGSEEVRRLAWALERSETSLHLAWGFDWVAPHRARFGSLGASTVLDLQPTRRPLPSRLAKAALDRSLGLVLLVAASPVLALMWAAVRLETAGPGFFKQTRVGLDGHPFTMVKMRTMFIDAEDRKESLRHLNHVDSTLFKIRTDPRVTRVGAFLRKTSLDELPQLVNVVRGEMSLIGPRPALQSEVALYGHDERRRMAVKPGITGLWQVSGRSDLSWDESIRLDLHYTDNWRLVDDALIAARTVTAVARARGAY